MIFYSAKLNDSVDKILVRMQKFPNVLFWHRDGKETCVSKFCLAGSKKGSLEVLLWPQNSHRLSESLVCPVSYKLVDFSHGVKTGNTL